MAEIKEEFILMVSGGVIAGIVIGSIILVGAIITVIIILVIRARNNATADSVVPVADVTCNVNADCTTGACDTSRNLCVECLDDTLCNGLRCKLDTFTCEECLLTTDCNVLDGETCQQNICCNPNDPTVDSVTYFDDPINPTLTIAYTPKQKRSVLNRVMVSITDPATNIGFGGSTCDQVMTDCEPTNACPSPCTQFTTLDETIVLNEASLGFKFYRGLVYRLVIQIFYTCGEFEDKTNAVIHDFITPTCPLPSAEVSDVVKVGFAPEYVVINSPNTDPIDTYDVLIDANFIRNPSWAVVVPTIVASMGPGPANLQKLDLPQSLPAGDYRIRVVRKGVGGSCDSRPSNVAVLYSAI